MHKDLDSIHDEYLRLREKIIKQLEGIPADSEQAKFLRSELEIINQKLGGLQGLYSAYIQRYIILLLFHNVKVNTSRNEVSIRCNEIAFHLVDI